MVLSFFHSMGAPSSSFRRKLGRHAPTLYLLTVVTEEQLPYVMYIRESNAPPSTNSEENHPFHLCDMGPL